MPIRVIAGVGGLLVLVVLRASAVRSATRRRQYRSVGSDTTDGKAGGQPERSSDAGRGERPTVSAVVPSFNEEHAIGWMLERIPPWVTEVVLVDGLSTDLTEVQARARRMKPDLRVVYQDRRGKGAAVRAGFAAARGEIVVMLDADGSTDPAEIGRYVDALVAGADFVKGSRELPQGGSEDFTMLRRVGNRWLVMLLELLFGCQFTDLCYGYMGFWRRHLDALALRADGFEIETELVLRGVKVGLAIEEVPSFERRRRAGKSNLHVVRDGSRVLRTIAREWITATSRPPSGGWREITLTAVEKPAVGCEGWLPAGIDHRRHERRGSAGAANGYVGSERRSGERRRRPAETTVVYIAELRDEGSPMLRASASG